MIEIRNVVYAISQHGKMLAHIVKIRNHGIQMFATP